MKVFIVYAVGTCGKNIKNEFKTLEFPGLPVWQIEKIKWVYSWRKSQGKQGCSTKLMDGSLTYCKPWFLVILYWYLLSEYIVIMMNITMIFG